MLGEIAMDKPPVRERILLIAPEPALGTVLRRLLESRGYEVCTADAGAQEIDLAIVDLPAGRALPETILRSGSLTTSAFVFLSARGDTPAVRRVVEANGGVLLPKPFTPEGLERCARRALARPRQSTEARAVRSSSSEVSPAAAFSRPSSHSVRVPPAAAASQTSS
jgi:DNA-binding response OmpR family regulator